jgi:hypothetical protein
MKASWGKTTFVLRLWSCFLCKIDAWAKVRIAYRYYSIVVVLVYSSDVGRYEYRKLSMVELILR